MLLSFLLNHWCPTKKYVYCLLRERHTHKLTEPKKKRAMSSLYRLSDLLISLLTIVLLLSLTTVSATKLQQQHVKYRNFDDVKMFIRGMRPPRKQTKLRGRTVGKSPTSAPTLSESIVIQVGAGLGEKCSSIIMCLPSFCMQSSCPEIQCIDSICTILETPTRFPTSSPVEIILP